MMRCKLIASGGGDGDLPDAQDPQEDPTQEPEPDENQPWWKIRITKDDLIVYGTAIAISYGIRE